MPAPISPKKRALMPSGKLRKALRAAGHHLSAVVQVGKEGLTEAVLRQLDEALRAHELVKVKAGTESPEDRFEIADRLAAEAGGQVAQILGRTVLVYRKHPEKPRFEAADPKPAGAAETADPVKRSRRRSGGRGGGRGARGAERKPASEKPSGRKPWARKPAGGKPWARKPAGGKPAGRRPSSRPRPRPRG